MIIQMACHLSNSFCESQKLLKMLILQQFTAQKRSIRQFFRFFFVVRASWDSKLSLKLPKWLSTTFCQSIHFAFPCLDLTSECSFSMGMTKLRNFWHSPFSFLLSLFSLSKSLLFWKKTHFCSKSLNCQTASKILFVSEKQVYKLPKSTSSTLKGVSYVFHHFSLFMWTFYRRNSSDLTIRGSAEY